MRRITIFSLLLFVVWGVSAQPCGTVNTAFKSGETLAYDLYFNWKFIWVKAGTASMNITQTIYKGEPAYRTRLITRGSKRADMFFTMRDTLVSYVQADDLTPLYFRKGANEGGSYRVDEVSYSYPQGFPAIRQKHIDKNGKATTREESSRVCIYDMLSMLLRARSFDASAYRKDHRIGFMMADGRKNEMRYLVYRGKSTFQIENSSTTYRCLLFSFVEKDGDREKEIVTFYVTDDANHIPVCLDLNLRFGTAKACLTGASGVRNPMSAKIK